MTLSAAPRVIDPPVPVSDEVPLVGAVLFTRVAAIPSETAFTRVWVLAPVDVSVIAVGVAAIAFASEEASWMVSSSTRIT